MMRGYWGGPGWEFGHHASGVGVAGMILMIILWIAVIVALVFGIRALIIHSRAKKADAATGVAPVAPYPPGAGPAPVGAPTPSLLAILEERYARGEIDRNEFLQRKQDLGLSGPVVPAASVPTTEPAVAPVPPPTDTTI
jgi:putative membrane protein